MSIEREVSCNYVSTVVACFMWRTTIGSFVGLKFECVTIWAFSSTHRLAPTSQFAVWRLRWIMLNIEETRQKVSGEHINTNFHIIILALFSNYFPLFYALVLRRDDDGIEKRARAGKKKSTRKEIEMDEEWKAAEKNRWKERQAASITLMIQQRMYSWKSLKGFLLGVGREEGKSKCEQRTRRRNQSKKRAFLRLNLWSFPFFQLHQLVCFSIIWMRLMKRSSNSASKRNPWVSNFNYFSIPIFDEFAMVQRKKKWTRKKNR